MTSLWISLRLSLPLSAIPGLHQRLSHFTPKLIRLEPTLIALDVTRSLRLFGGPRALWRRIVGTAPIDTRAGLAPSAWGAALLAQRGAGPRRALRPTTLERYLDRLSCRLLCATALQTRLLQAWGCDTLGQLRRLPRAGLAQRGLRELLAQLDRAYEPCTPAGAHVAPDLTFEASREPLFRGTHMAALNTALEPLVQAFCDWLQAHQLAAQQVRLVLLHDASRMEDPYTRILLNLTQPQWRAQAWLDLLRLHLQSAALPGPVQAITLHCARAQARHSFAATLFPDAQSEDRHVRRLWDVLRARLGHEALQFPQPTPWPLPEQAESWSVRPLDACPTGAARRWPDSRPFWLLAEPAALTLDGHRLFWQGQVLHLTAGPERIEQGWWHSHPVHRDYFTARDAQSVRYWVYRDLHSGDWFLHGLFA